MSNHPPINLEVEASQHDGDCHYHHVKLFAKSVDYGQP